MTEFGLFWQTAQELLKTVDIAPRVRLMGLTVSNAQDLESPELYPLEFDFRDGQLKQYGLGATPNPCMIT